jgi:hypothetical protein
LAESENKPNFWTTIPGLLTGVAAVLTAVTGFLVVVHPHGFDGPKDGSQAAVSSNNVARDAAKTSPNAVGETPTSGSAMPRQQKPTALVLGKDGTETRVFLNTFRDSYSGETIQLKNGQSIPFEKIKSVDFLDVHEYEEDVRVTLTDGRALEGTIMSGERITGDTDVGAFSISVKSLKRISFER